MLPYWIKQSRTKFLVTSVQLITLSIFKFWELYKHMPGEDQLIPQGFKEAGIYEAINDTQKFWKSGKSVQSIKIPW